MAKNINIDEFVSNAFDELMETLRDVVSDVVESKGEVFDESEYEIAEDEVFGVVDNAKDSVVHYLQELAKLAPTIED